MTARGTLAALLLPLALLSACGDESGSAAADPGTSEPSPTETTSPPETPTEPTESTSEAETPDWPACGDVWVADAKLPLGYKGCLDGDEALKADNLSCSSGQRIVRHQDRFYATAGGMIYRTEGPLEKDKGYLEAIATCRG